MTTVLLADDDEELRQVYAIWLDGLDGVAVRTADDGAAALEAFDEAVDLAVLDRRMPGATGDEVAREIRESDTDCTIVIASAFEPDGNLPAEDYDRYLSKPISQDDLTAQVDAVRSEVPAGG